MSAQKYDDINQLIAFVASQVYTNTTNAVKAIGIQDSIVSTILTLTGSTLSNFQKIAVIDANGDDSTATIGGQKAFATFASANTTFQNAGIQNGLIIVNPGTYNPPPGSLNIFLTNTNYYFYPGAVVHKTAGAPIIYEAFQSRVYGYGTFLHDTTPVFVPLAGSEGIIEFSTIENYGGNVTIEVQQGTASDIHIAFVGKSNGTSFSNYSNRASIKHNASVPAINVQSSAAASCIVTFENCLIQNTGDNPTVDGIYDTHVDSYVKFQNCQISNDGGSNVAPAVNGTGTLVLYDCIIVAQSTAGFSIDITGDLYHNNNVLTNIAANVTGSTIGPAGGLAVDAAANRLF